MTYIELHFREILHFYGILAKI